MRGTSVYFSRRWTTPGEATPRPAEAGPRPARDAGGRAAVDARGRAHMRGHGGLRRRRRAVAADVLTLENGIPATTRSRGCSPGWTRRAPEGAAAPSAGLGGPARQRGGGGRQGAAAVVRGRLGAVADAPPAGVRGGIEADVGAGAGGRQVERDPGTAGAAELVDAKGRTVTADAMQRATRDGGGDRRQGRRLRAAAEVLPPRPLESVPLGDCRNVYWPSYVFLIRGDATLQRGNAHERLRHVR